MHEPAEALGKSTSTMTGQVDRLIRHSLLVRPVLMTSLTTIFGMMPLTLSRGERSEIWNALGITVIGGLFVSGIVTLVLVPLLYSEGHYHRQRVSRRKAT